MKKLVFILTLSLISIGLSACTCECVGANDNNPDNKVCKTEYENLNGQGTWAAYESSAKSSGMVCK